MTPDRPDKITRTLAKAEEMCGSDDYTKNGGLHRLIRQAARLYRAKLKRQRERKVKR